MKPTGSVTSQEHWITDLAYPLAENAASHPQSPAVRNRFFAAVEIYNADSGEQIVPVMSTVTRHGCRVRTGTPFRPGTRVSLRIRHQGATVRSEGQVVYSIPGEAMAIRFDNMEVPEQVALNQWLLQVSNEALESRVRESTDLAPSVKQEIVVVLSILALAAIAATAFVVTMLR